MRTPDATRVSRVVEPAFRPLAEAAAPYQAFGEGLQRTAQALMPLWQESIQREKRRELNAGEAHLNDLYTEIQGEALQRNDYNVYPEELNTRYSEASQEYLSGVQDPDVREALSEVSNRSGNAMRLNMIGNSFQQSEQASLFQIEETLRSDVRRFTAQPLEVSLAYLENPTDPNYASGGIPITAALRRIRTEGVVGGVKDPAKLESAFRNQLAVEFANRLESGVQSGEITVEQGAELLENRGHALLSHLNESQRTESLSSLGRVQKSQLAAQSAAQAEVLVGLNTAISTATPETAPRLREQIRAMGFGPGKAISTKSAYLGFHKAIDSAVKSYQGTVDSVSSLIDRTQGGPAVPENPDNQKAADQIYAAALAKISAANLPPEDLAKAKAGLHSSLSLASSDWGFMPKDWERDIVSLITSKKPSELLEGAGIIQALSLQHNGPYLMSKFSAEQIHNANLVLSMVQGNATTEEAAQFAFDVTSQTPDQKAASVRYRKELKADSGAMVDEAMTEFVDDIDENLFFDANVPVGLQEQFGALFSSHYELGGNRDAAYKTALTLMRREVGATSVGSANGRGGTLTVLPPERVMNASTDQVESAVMTLMEQRGLGDVDIDDIVLTPDPTSAAGPVSYNITYLAPGDPIPKQVIDEESGHPVMWVPDIVPEEAGAVSKFMGLFDQAEGASPYNRAKSVHERNKNRSDLLSELQGLTGPKPAPVLQELKRSPAATGEEPSQAAYSLYSPIAEKVTHLMGEAKRLGVELSEGVALKASDIQQELEASDAAREKKERELLGAMAENPAGWLATFSHAIRRDLGLTSGPGAEALLEVPEFTAAYPPELFFGEGAKETGRQLLEFLGSQSLNIQSNLDTLRLLYAPRSSGPKRVAYKVQDRGQLLRDDSGAAVLFTPEVKPRKPASAEELSGRWSRLLDLRSAFPRVRNGLHNPLSMSAAPEKPLTIGRDGTVKNAAGVALWKASRYVEALRELTKTEVRNQWSQLVESQDDYPARLKTLGVPDTEENRDILDLADSARFKEDIKHNLDLKEKYLALAEQASDTIEERIRLGESEDSERNQALLSQAFKLVEKVDALDAATDAHISSKQKIIATR